MVEQIRHPDGRIEHPTSRYEPTDASFRAILFILLGALVFAVVVQAAVWWFFIHYRDYQAESKRSPYPLAPGPSTALPHEPRLEQVERLAGEKAVDAYEREAANLEVLRTTGPSADKGYVHIPIDRAMQLIVEKKMLPSRPEPSAEERRRGGGLVDSGASNSGRLFKEDAK